MNDAAAATTKKLQKQAALAEYFRKIDGDDDLRRAVRYAGGRAFPATEERVLAVGGAIVSDVALQLLRLDPDDYHDLVVRSGEIGEALAKVWPVSATDPSPPDDAANSEPRSASASLPLPMRGERAGERGWPSREDAARSTPLPNPLPTHGEREQIPPLRLADLSAAFDELARTGNQQRKREILLHLFSRCQDPREAAYLCKIIFRDMRTGVQEGVLQAAVALAFDKKLADVQRCQLLVGDLDEVAVLARHDALATARFRLFHPIQFMLATPQETPADAAGTMAGRTFFVEDKLDGIRAQIHKSGSRIAIYTRTMDRTDVSFPDVVEAVAKIPGEVLLDGEIVPWCDGCVLPFAHIQRRLGRKVLSPRILKENPAAFIAFDILYHDGELLMDRPLRERREILAQLALGREHGAAPLQVTDMASVTTEADVMAAFAVAKDRRNEGIVLKDPESIYAPGRRGKMWLKLKTHLPTLDCVVTAAEYGHGKRRNSLSDYTFAVWDREPTEPGAQLVNVGKAYSGVTDAEIAQLTELFLSIATRKWGRVHYVPPRVVLEIAFDQIQQSTRHKSGFALRFPRIKRIRWDKRPEDADRLDRVKEIHRSTTNTAYRDTAPDLPPEPTLFDGLM